MEVSGSCKRLEFWKIGKGFGLWRKERNKGKGKRKRNYKGEDIFLEEKMKIMKVADSRDSVADAEIFRENIGIVRNSSISERPEIIIKNQEY